MGGPEEWECGGDVGWGGVDWLPDRWMSEQMSVGMNGWMDDSDSVDA